MSQPDRSSLLGFTIADFIQHVLSMLFALISVLLFSRTLLFYIFLRDKLCVKSLSWCMISYLSCNLLGMAIQTIYHVLQIALMRDLAEWVDNIILTMNYTFGIPMFFLALERCLAIQMAMRFTPRLKSILLTVNLMFNPGILIVTFFVTWPGDILWALWGMKMIVGILNICLCGFLVWKVRRIGTSTNDVIVRKTAILEVFLEVLPNFATHTIYRIMSCDAYSLIISYYFYPSLPYLTQSLSALICGIIYNKSLSARPKNRIIIINSAMTNHSNTLSSRPVNIAKNATLCKRNGSMFVAKI